MTDYTEHGAVPADDAAVDDPPTVDEVAEEQHRRGEDIDPGHHGVARDREQAASQDMRDDGGMDGQRKAVADRDAELDEGGPTS